MKEAVNNPIFGSAELESKSVSKLTPMAPMPSSPALSQELLTDEVHVQRIPSPPSPLLSSAPPPRRKTDDGALAPLICTRDKGTKISYLLKILEDSSETNVNKKQLAKELVKYDMDGDGWISTNEMMGPA